MTNQNRMLKKVLSDKPSTWQTETDFREANQNAINRAFEIALIVMHIMDEKGWNQSDLAKEMKVTRQAVSKILRGDRPISMPTVDKLEAVLGVQLLKVCNPKQVEASPLLAKTFTLPVNTYSNAQSSNYFPGQYSGAKCIDERGRIGLNKKSEKSAKNYAQIA